MTAVELMKALISGISEIDDASFLKALKTIVDLKTSNQIISLSPAQLAEIIESKRDIEQGNFIHQSELDNEFY
jgi:hypothetical protein